MLRVSVYVASLAVLGLPGVLAAQSQAVPTAALTKAAATITAPDVARRVNIIAHDSMLGRDTPSRGLELTAQYVADEFKRLGLKPGGENATWFQRYAISKVSFDVAKSHIGFMGGAGHLHAEFASDARFIFGSIPAKPFGAEAVVVAGISSADQIIKADVAGKIVLLVLDFGNPAGMQAFSRVGPALLAADAKGVVMVSNRADAMFEQMGRAQMRARTVVGEGKGGAIVEVREQVLAEWLKGRGVDVAATRAATTPMTKVLAGVTVDFDIVRTVLEANSAPNTVGILEGTDPKLKREYVVYSAHMDHIGIRPGQPDSIANGADDDASGTVGVIELAEAFVQKGARPKRSLVFLTVSGEEKGLWGSEYYAEHPTVPLPQIVANINIDMIGRNWKDSIVAIGKEHSDLGQTLAQVNAQHPELRMTAIDDIWPQERFYFRSDHYNFARKGVPILFFFNGVHADYHQVSDDPSLIDSEKEARILKLLFFLGHEVASRPATPMWNPESYKQIVGGAGR
jgi:hypothetical protein